MRLTGPEAQALFDKLPDLGETVVLQSNLTVQEMYSEDEDPQEIPAGAAIEVDDYGCPGSFVILTWAKSEWTGSQADLLEAIGGDGWLEQQEYFAAVRSPNQQKFPFLEVDKTQ